MSASTAADTAAVRVRQIERRGRGWRRGWRWITVVALPIGPLSITVLRGILPYWTDDDPRAIAQAVIDNPALMTGIGWSSLVGLPSMLLGVLAIGFVSRRGAPLLATLGAGITFLAFSNWTAGGNPDLLALTMGQQGYSVDEIVALSTAMSESGIAAATGGFWVVGHIVGMILLGVGLGRARIVNWWIAGALIVSQPIHLVAAIIIPSRLLDVTLGWGLTTLAFTVVAIVIARMPDQEWDPWPGEAEPTAKAV